MWGGGAAAAACLPGCWAACQCLPCCWSAALQLSSQGSLDINSLAPLLKEFAKLTPQQISALVPLLGRVGHPQLLLEGSAALRTPPDARMDTASM